MDDIQTDDLWLPSGQLAKDDPLYGPNGDKPKKRERIKGQFLPPIPLEWFEKAARLPGKALQVASVIRRQAALIESKSTPLPNGPLISIGVDVFAKSRALLSLEKAGLIIVERKPGCNPIVTIVEIEGKPRE